VGADGTTEDKDQNGGQNKRIKLDSAASRQKQLDLSEQALLKSKQVLANLKSEGCAMSVTVKAVQAAQTLVRQRLAQKFLDLYAEDYTMSAQASQGERCGMAVLTDLREVEESLASGLSVVEVAHGTSIDMVQLSRACDKAFLSGFEVHRSNIPTRLSVVVSTTSGNLVLVSGIAVYACTCLDRSTYTLAHVWL